MEDSLFIIKLSAQQATEGALVRAYDLVGKDAWGQLRHRAGRHLAPCVLRVPPKPAAAHSPLFCEEAAAAADGGRQSAARTSANPCRQHLWLLITKLHCPSADCATVWPAASTICTRRWHRSGTSPSRTTCEQGGRGADKVNHCGKVNHSSSKAGGVALQAMCVFSALAPANDYPARIARPVPHPPPPSPSPDTPARWLSGSRCRSA